MAPAAEANSDGSSTTPANTGVVVGGTIGGLVLVVAITACAFPFLRNWVLGWRSDKRKYHIRKLSLPDKIGVPLLVKSNSRHSHSRSDGYTPVTASFITNDYDADHIQTHRDPTPFIPRTDYSPTDEYSPSSSRAPRKQSTVDSIATTDSAYSSVYSSRGVVPAPKPPPLQPLPPVPRSARFKKSIKRKAPSKEDLTRPVNRADTSAISRMLKARIERGGHATPLRQPTDFSIIERPESTLVPPVPTVIHPPMTPKPAPSNPITSPSRPIRPLPQPRNKSLRLPKAPMEPLVEVDNPTAGVSGTSEVFPEPAAKTWKGLEVHLEAPPSAIQYTRELTAESPDEDSDKPLTYAFRNSTLSSPTDDVAPRYPSIGAYPFAPLDSAPLTSSMTSAFPSSARYSAFPMSAAPPDSAYPFSAIFSTGYDTAADTSMFPTSAFPSSAELLSPEDETPTRWAESIIDAYATASKRYTWAQQYATTAPLRLDAPARRNEPRKKSVRRQQSTKGGTAAETATKKLRLDIVTDDDSVYASRPGSTGTNLGSNESAMGTGTITTRNTGTDYMSALPPDSADVASTQKARLREVDVKSTKQGFQERPLGVGHSYQARTFI